MNLDTNSRAQHLTAFFNSKHIRVNPSWVHALLSQIDPGASPSITNDGLQDIAVRQFLHSNIRQSILPTVPLLPGPDTERASVTQVLVQVVDCHEVGFSLTQQLDRLEAFEERQKPVSRRLIRLTENEENETDERHETQAAAPERAADDERGLVGKKMVKVMLEDAKGNRLYGIEQKPIDQFRMGMPLGAKLILTDVPVVHGVLILRPTKIEWLGGAIDAWNNAASKSNIQQQIKQVREMLQSRLSEFPVMNSRQRQEATRAAVQEQQAQGLDDEYDDDQGQMVTGAHQRRGTRGGRGNTARGRGTTRGARRARGRGRGS